MPGFEWIGAEEKQEVLQVLEQGFTFRYNFEGMRNGLFKAQELESLIAQRLGSEHVHLVSSGTTALISALACAGVGAGDEVILPTFTFVASVEAILAVGAVPVFVDIDDTLCLDPNAVAAAIGPRTRAINVVHMCGGMADLAPLQALAKAHDLVLLEDAAQAVGGSYHGRALGTIGDVGAVSFDSVKTISCAEGGAVLCQDAQMYARVHQYSDHGHDHIGLDRGAEEHPMLGNNYRISELQAALGIAQWRKLDAMLDCQRSNKAQLKSALGQYSEVSFRRLPDADGDNAGFLSFFLPSQARTQEVLEALQAAGMGGVFYWYVNKWHYFKRWQHLHNLASPNRLAINDMPHPDYAKLEYPKSDALMARTLSILINLSWSQADIDQRIDTFSKVFK